MKFNKTTLFLLGGLAATVALAEPAKTDKFLDPRLVGTWKCRDAGVVVFMTHESDGKEHYTVYVQAHLAEQADGYWYVRGTRLCEERAKISRYYDSSIATPVHDSDELVEVSQDYYIIRNSFIGKLLKYVRIGESPVKQENASTKSSTTQRP